MQGPEGNKAAVIAIHTIEEMLAPAACRNRCDFHFDQLKTHHALIEVMGFLHVARCQC